MWNSQALVRINLYVKFNVHSSYAKHVKVLKVADRRSGLKKNIVCFRFPTDPIKTCATQIYFMDFPKKKKKKKFFFFFRKSIGPKLRDDLLAVVKVTKKTLRKGEGGQKATKKQKIIM